MHAIEHTKSIPEFVLLVGTQLSANLGPALEPNSSESKAGVARNEHDQINH